MFSVFVVNPNVTMKCRFPFALVVADSAHEVVEVKVVILVVENCLTASAENASGTALITEECSALWGYAKAFVLFEM